MQRRQPGAVDCRWEPGGGTPCNIIPKSLINPIGQKLINLYPLPNANNPALGYNYVSQPVRKLDEGKFDIRVDENLISKGHVVRALQLRSGDSRTFPAAHRASPNRARLPATRASAITPAMRPFRKLTFFRSNTVNQITFGFNRIFDYITSQGTAVASRNAIGIPDADLGGNSCGLTSVELTGPYWSLGDRGYTPFVGGTNVWTTSDSLDMVRGKHNIRIGGGIRANQLNTVAVGFPNGFWVIAGSSPAIPRRTC